MAAELTLETSLGCTAPDHAVGVYAVHRFASEFAGFAARRSEKGSSAIISDAGRGDIVVDEALGLVVHGHP